MMHFNYLITCGTSQLDAAVLSSDAIGFTEAEALDFEHAVQDNQLSYEVFYRNQLAVAQQIITRLGSRLDNLGDYLGKQNNPFGAEISTIWGLVRQHAGNEQASYKILASDSTAGYFSARILKELLKRMTDQAIDDPVTVGNLKEDPASNIEVNDAMNNLIDAAYNLLISGRSPHGLRNIIVISGGFKSVVPCLTLFATVYGLELVYLFEKSSQVQRLTPVVKLREKNKRDRWVDYWKFVLESGEVPAESYLYRLLNQRIRVRDDFFYS